MAGRTVHQVAARLLLCVALFATPAAAQGLTGEQLVRRDYQSRIDAVTERIFVGAVAERCGRRPMAWFALVLRTSYADYERATAEFGQRHAGIDFGRQPEGAAGAAMLLGQRLVERVGDAVCGSIAPPDTLAEIDRYILSATPPR
jgi:hypothetical protein